MSACDYYNCNTLFILSLLKSLKLCNTFVSGIYLVVFAGEVEHTEEHGGNSQVLICSLYAEISLTIETLL